MRESIHGSPAARVRVVAPLVLALAALASPSVASAQGAPAPAAAKPAETKPHGVHTLYLVRHGDYDVSDARDDDVGKALTALGKQQAQLVTQRLASMPVRFDGLYVSTMTRARETAAIVAATLPYLKPDPVRDLRECTPPMHADEIHDLRPGEADSCRAQIDVAFTRFFKPSPSADRRDILVCHGNVIRYCCMRALGVDALAWNHMTIANCSLTVIQVRADGTMRLVSYDDVGHLPPLVQTYTGGTTMGMGVAPKVPNGTLAPPDSMQHH